MAPRALKPPTVDPAVTYEPSLARVAALVAEPARARMLCFLLSGEVASAGELAAAAAVTPATASAHLARLLDEGVLACEPRGRHRYYRLADGEMAQALESLALVAERATHTRDWASPARARLRHARCCYGHLAGQLGVGLCDQLRARGWLAAQDGGLGLTPTGAEGLTQLGLDGSGWLQRTNASGPRRLAYPCLDWSERRDHLAGKLAAALLSHFLDQGWLRRLAPTRALALTPPGERALGALLRPGDRPQEQGADLVRARKPSRAVR